MKIYIMTNSNFFPRTDAEFDQWQENTMEIVKPNLITWGILADDFTEVESYQTVWNTTYSKASNKQNRTSADVTAKIYARENYEKALRHFVAQWLSSNKKVTDSDRTRMGLTVKSGTRTAVAVPTSIVEATIDFSVVLQHNLHFYDQYSSGSRAKPDGVHGCEIYIKIDGDAPVDNSEFDYLATCTSTPYLVNFEGNKIGKKIWYRFRWVNTRGEVGPWSTVYGAIVAG
jgi:hypothetical protein